LNGLFRLIIIKKLKGSELNGYKLIESIGEIVGKKPSSGTIYPLLARLENEGLLKHRVEGKSKYYSLTAKGKRQHAKMMNEKRKKIESIVETYNCLFDNPMVSDKYKKMLKEKDMLDNDDHFKFAAPYLKIESSILEFVFSDYSDKELSTFMKTVDDFVKKIKKITKK
jgi:DNA-binding PadR family transcriptional regulator